jgi:hypothetical protein
MFHLGCCIFVFAVVAFRMFNYSLACWLVQSLEVPRVLWDVIVIHIDPLLNNFSYLMIMDEWIYMQIHLLVSKCKQRIRDLMNFRDFRFSLFMSVTLGQ